MSYREELTGAVKELVRGFPGYEDIGDGTLLALLTRNHQLLIGEPGTGKSLYAMSFFGMFQGAPIFRVGCSQSTKAEDLFGGYVVNKILSEGEYIRNIEGGLLTAVFAYLDELLDVPDMVLRGALLNVLNERVYRTKDDPIENLPLHTVIATTNFNRVTEAIRALLDRFVFKAYSPQVTSYTARMGIYDTYLEGRIQHLPTLEYAGLVDLADLVARKPSEGGIQISFGFELLHAYVLDVFEARALALVREQLTQRLRREPTPQELASAAPNLSQRTENEQFEISRAVAVLYGRPKVIPDDVRAYKYGCLTLGANPALEALWDEVCLSCIPTKERDLKQLEALGNLAHDMSILRQERSQNSGIVNLLGGQAPTQAALQLREWLGAMRKPHPTVVKLTESLLAEIDELQRPTSISSLDLSHDWAAQ